MTFDRILTHRQEFPFLDQYAYFNYGGQGLMSRRALEAVTQAQETLQRIAPFSQAAYDYSLQLTDDLRRAIAGELGASPDSITLTEDTTVGCNIALWGLDWQAGDHLLITDCEHQGVLAIVQELQHRFGIEVSVCPLLPTLNGGDPVATLVSHLRPNTRMVVLSHVLWNTGQVLPLEPIVAGCRSHSDRVRILVDAAQSVGVLPLNLTTLGADYYAFTCHKWWCGSAGVGGIYVRPEVREELRPTFIGWRSIRTNAQGKPIAWEGGGKRYEVATSAVALYPGVTAAIHVQQEFASAVERYEMICDRSRYLWQQLQTIPQVKTLRSTPPESGLVSFQMTSGQHKALVTALEAEGILVRLLLDPNCVRACTHYLTVEAEIDRLVGAIAAIIDR